MAIVKDVIKNRKLIIVKLNTPIKEVIKILLEQKLTNVPVVDANNKLCGVVSEKDIITSFESSNLINKKAKDVMVKKITYVKESDALEKVAKIFTEKPLRKLPVVKKGKIIGVITRDDIISSFMKYY